MNVTHWLVIGLTLGGRATNRFLTHNREVWHLMTTQRLDHSPPFSGLEDVDQADGSALQPGWQEWQDPDHLWRRGGEWLYGPAGYSKSKLQTRIFLKSMVTITVAVSGPKARDRSKICTGKLPPCPDLIVVAFWCLLFYIICWKNLGQGQWKHLGLNIVPGTCKHVPSPTTQNTHRAFSFSNWWIKSSYVWRSWSTMIPSDAWILTGRSCQRIRRRQSRLVEPLSDPRKLRQRPRQSALLSQRRPGRKSRPQM